MSFCFCTLWLMSSLGQAADPPLHNSQVETPKLTTPAQALAMLDVPPGFRKTLFAAEPWVRQPIGFTIDPRGRLWVAENYTYCEMPVHFDDRYSDRIVILEDTNNDGEADKRTVFWDKAKQLTSVELGLGGVWLMCPPQLLFVPDRDGDDRPDGPPEVVLDGFTIGPQNRHNFANGLKWGPDGWLYGRHGITYVGKVGRPGAADRDRTELGPGIWRYHPLRKKFEVYCTGTTNPWGHDWNAAGDLFFINTVIGHLWHAIPGAHFKRMFGADPNPHVYELLDQTADHVHWDTREAWNDAKKGLSQTTSQAGGGHAHCGFMIYQGDNWPKHLHGKAFTLNMHGRRMNVDSLHPRPFGISYVGKHEPDMFFSRDPWFRATELTYGPDGGVFIADWSDIGECHEHDGVHRDSGRIFKITYGPTAWKPEDLAKLPTTELWERLKHANQWHVRTARRLLQDRFATGEKMEEFRQASFDLWTLHVTGGVDRPKLVGGINAGRSGAISLAVDDGAPAPEIVAALAARAGRRASGEADSALLQIASALQRLRAKDRWTVASALIDRRDALAHDPILSLMTWFGLESAVPDGQYAAAQLAASGDCSLVRRFIARRLTEDIAEKPASVEILLRFCNNLAPTPRRDVLLGMAEALRGVRKAKAPQGWKEFSSGADPQLVAELGAVFGDGRALADLQVVAKNPNLDASARRSAIRSLVDAKPADLFKTLESLLGDKEVAADAVRGLAAANDPRVTDILVQRFGGLYPQAKEAAVETLAARPTSANAMLDAVATGRIARDFVPVTTVRQLQGYGDAALAGKLQKLWPELQPISASKKTLIAGFKTRLTAESLAKADLAKGRAVYEKSCGKCHKLFGAGGEIGPDITGSQRHNMDYLLENIVDPSATLLGNYRVSTFLLADGRTVVGLPLRRTARTVEIQTVTDKLTLQLTDVEKETPANKSLMPDGLLDVLTPEEVRDLVGYLQRP